MASTLLRLPDDLQALIWRLYLDGLRARMPLVVAQDELWPAFHAHCTRRGEPASLFAMVCGLNRTAGVAMVRGGGAARAWRIDRRAVRRARRSSVQAFVSGL